VEYAGNNSPDPRNYRVDFTKITRVLPEFNTCWTAKSGARQLYKAYKENDLTLEDFQGRKYIRLNQLKHLLNNNQLGEQLRWNEGPTRVSERNENSHE
jgi:hypothetical protein